MTRMRKVMAIGGGIVFIITALFTSTSLKEFTMSAERKINAAIPPSEKLNLATRAAFEAASGSQWRAIEEELDARMKIRALRCAKGYAPPFYVRVKAAQKNLTDIPCFNDADNEIAQWLNLRRVGVMLSKPAFKPVPTPIPSYIVADASVQDVNFADNAGIALLETPSAIQIINLETQKPILREMKGTSVPGRISANGRIFVVGDGNRLKFRDTESGGIITELNDIAVKTFYWLDETSALYNKSGSEKTFIVDFVAGKEIPVQAINKKLLSVARLGQTTNQFVTIAQSSITKIELIRTQGGLEVKLRDEKQDDVFSASANASGVTSDGNYFFNIDDQINIVSLSTLTNYSAPLESFRARYAVATADPDKILLIGATSSGKHPEDNNRLFSISQRTLTPLFNARITAQRYVYANALRREALISDNKIALADIFPGNTLTTPAKENDAKNVNKPASATSPEKTVSESPDKADIKKESKSEPVTPAASAANAEAKPSSTEKEGEKPAAPTDRSPAPANAGSTPSPEKPSSKPEPSATSTKKASKSKASTLQKKRDLSQTT